MVSIRDFGVDLFKIELNYYSGVFIGFYLYDRPSPVKQLFTKNLLMSSSS